MKSKLALWLIVAVVLFGGLLVIQNANIGTEALWRVSDGGQWLLPLVVVAALIDSINPCAFSILLLTVAFLFSLGKTRKGILNIGLTYIGGIFVVYVLIGLGILQALHLFNTPHFVAKAAAYLLLLFAGINLANHFFPTFPIKLKIPNAAHRKIASLMEQSSLPTAFVLGALVGLCEFPCTGGPYLLVLGLLHDAQTYARGLGYLLFYNILFVVPLVVALFIASNEMLLEKVQMWRKNNTRAMRLWSSIAMIGLALLMLSL